MSSNKKHTVVDQSIYITSFANALTLKIKYQVNYFKLLQILSRCKNKIRRFDLEFEGLHDEDSQNERLMHVLTLLPLHSIYMKDCVIRLRISTLLVISRCVNLQTDNCMLKFPARVDLTTWIKKLRLVNTKLLTYWLNTCRNNLFGNVELAQIADC